MGGAGCCDSKPFGEPCADCVFDEATTHKSEAQVARGLAAVDPDADAALAFGLTTGKSSQGASPFWSAVAALQVFSAHPSASGDHGVQLVKSLRSTLVPPAAPMVFGDPKAKPPKPKPASTMPPKPLWDPLEGERHELEVYPEWDWELDAMFSGVDPWDPDPELDRPDTTSGGGRCCVLSFDYPATFRFINKPKGNRIKVGARFTTFAEYIDGGGCDCSCCEFQQLVETDFSFLGGMPAAPLRPQEGTTDGLAVEDCFIKWGPDAPPGHRGQVENNVHARATGADRARIEKWAERISCYGTRPKKGGPTLSQLFTPCWYWMLDEPHNWVARGINGHTNWRFVGRILDTCHQRKPVIAREFSMSWQHPAPKGTEKDGGMSASQPDPVTGAPRPMGTS